MTSTLIEGLNKNFKYNYMKRNQTKINKLVITLQ